MATFGFVIPSVGAFADETVITDLAQQGEELGYADAWFGDHIVVPAYASHLLAAEWLEPLTACQWVLARTSTLRVGTDVLVVPYRHPLLTAKVAACMDHLSKGRLTLGVGVGYLRGEFAALGSEPAVRGDVTDEWLTVFRQLWESDGHPTGFHGDFTDFDDICFGPSPVQRPLPIWVGGNVGRALERAARLGDGWHPLFPSPEAYRHGRETISALREQVDTPFVYSFSCATTVLLDSEPDTFVTDTWDEMGDIPSDFTYAPPVPATASGRPRFVGSPDSVASDIDEYIAAGVEHFTLRFANGLPTVDPSECSRQMTLFAKEVMSRHV